MINARRKRLMAKVEAAKRTAAGVPSGTLIGTSVAASVASNLIVGKHYFVETQPDETGEMEVFAIYRTADLLSTIIDGDAIETPAPVHVFEIATDAVVCMGVLDKLVDKIDEVDENYALPEWPEIASPTATVDPEMIPPAPGGTTVTN